MTTGKLLRKIRERQEIQQVQLADRMSVTQQCVSNWERGVREVPCEELPRLSRCLGCRDLISHRLRECPVYQEAKRLRDKEKTAA